MIINYKKLYITLILGALGVPFIAQGIGSGSERQPRERAPRERVERGRVEIDRSSALQARREARRIRLRRSASIDKGKNAIRFKGPFEGSVKGAFGSSQKPRKAKMMTVSSSQFPVTVDFGSVKTPKNKKGHQHLIINKGFVSKGSVIPKDNTHIHFGDTKVVNYTLESLPPGEHTLTLQFGDKSHISYGDKYSKTIMIMVTK